MCGVVRDTRGIEWAMAGTRSYLVTQGKVRVITYFALY